jgi:hypothetical protein
MKNTQANLTRINKREVSVLPFLIPFSGRILIETIFAECRMDVRRRVLGKRGTGKKGTGTTCLMKLSLNVD